MTMNKKSITHIGWRTIKTACAVFLVITLFEFTNRGTPMLAALSAIFCLRDSHHTSLKFAYVRVIGNVVGALLASCIIQVGYSGTLLGSHWFQIIAGSMGIIIVIQICNILGRSDSIINSSATFLVVFYNTPLDNIANYGFNRVLDTIIGSLIAVAINFMLPGGSQDNHNNN